MLGTSDEGFSSWTMGRVVHEPPSWTISSTHLRLVETILSRCLYRLNVVEESQNLLSLHRGLSRFRRLAFNEDVLDGLHFELPFLLVVFVSQLQPLIRDFAGRVLKLGKISWHDIFWVNRQQLANRESLITHVN